MDLIVIALAGAVLALDATSVGQFMISRPLVAGAVTGWIVGDPSQGFLVGLILELYLLVSFPTGGARFPDGATAAVVAVAAASASSGPGALPVAVAVGLVWGHIGGHTTSALRRLNGRLVPASGADVRVSAISVERLHLGAVFLDGFRGAAVTLTGAWVGRFAVTHAAGGWPLQPPGTIGMLLVGGAVSAGILLQSFGGLKRHRVAFVTGLALGVLGGRLL